MNKNEFLLFLSFLVWSSKPFLESMWNVIALLTSIFSLPGSKEELHWLIIAEMKGTLTLSTKWLGAFNVAHYVEGKRLLEKLESAGALLSGQPASKGFIISNSDIAKQLGQLRKQGKKHIKTLLA